MGMRRIKDINGVIMFIFQKYSDQWLVMPRHSSNTLLVTILLGVHFYLKTILFQYISTFPNLLLREKGEVVIMYLYLLIYILTHALNRIRSNMGFAVCCYCIVSRKFSNKS